MRRNLPTVLIIIVVVLTLGCRERVWDNQYDPESTTYPKMEYFAYDSYYYSGGFYIMKFRLKFINATVKDCKFYQKITRDGSELSSGEFNVPPGYIGVDLGVASLIFPLPAGTYKIELSYGGEFYAEASHIHPSFSNATSSLEMKLESFYSVIRE